MTPRRLRQEKCQDNVVVSSVGGDTVFDLFASESHSLF